MATDKDHRPVESAKSRLFDLLKSKPSQQLTRAELEAFRESLTQGADRISPEDFEAVIDALRREKRVEFVPATGALRLVGEAEIPVSDASLAMLILSAFTDGGGRLTRDELSGLRTRMAENPNDNVTAEAFDTCIDGLVRERRLEYLKSGDLAIVPETPQSPPGAWQVLGAASLFLGCVLSALGLASLGAELGAWLLFGLSAIAFAALTATILRLGRPTKRRRAAGVEMFSEVLRRDPTLLVISAVVLFFLIVSGISMHNGRFWLTRLADPSAARGFITGLFAFGTIGLAVILCVFVLVSSRKEDEVRKRLEGAKEVFTLLVGILGTVIGFYFGTTTSDLSGSPRLSGLRLTQIAPGRVIASARITGGTAPYQYWMEAVPGDTPIHAGESEDGDLWCVAALPATAEGISIRIRDAAEREDWRQSGRPGSPELSGTEQGP